MSTLEMIRAKIKKLIRSVKNALTGRPDRFLKDVSGVVHVGANVGQERDLYSSYGLDVIWVEPIPKVFDQLSSNIRGLKRQRALQALVTDVDDREYKFHIANNNGASSSILDFKEHKDIWPSVEYTESVHLTSITLATLFKREHIDTDKYQALILDTQGSELLVLRGCLPVLTHFKYIKAEVPDFESYSGCCQLDDVSAFLGEQGYNEMCRNKFASRAKGGSYFDVVYRKEV